MLNQDADTKNLKGWLSSVHQHLEQRRVDRSALPRPKRNRERERARREARQLFIDYHAEFGARVQ